jgi:hypothetical protein
MYNTVPLKEELKRLENQLKTNTTDENLISQCATFCLMIGTLDGDETYLSKAIEYGEQMTSQPYREMAADNKRKIKEERERYYNNLKTFYSVLSQNQYISDIIDYLDDHIAYWSAL